MAFRLRKITLIKRYDRSLLQNCETERTNSLLPLFARLGSVNNKPGEVPMAPRACKVTVFQLKGFIENRHDQLKGFIKNHHDKASDTIITTGPRAYP